MKARKICILCLCLCVCLSLLSGCGNEVVDNPSNNAQTTVSFNDSVGRIVELPAEINRIAPSGSVATMILATIAPDYMVTVSTSPSQEQQKYLPMELKTLPETGQMYGSKSTLNLETLLQSQAQVVIDIGEKKNGIAEDLDKLQEQIGIPVLFIEADLQHMASAYRTLGSLLVNKEERGEVLANFVEKTITMAEQNSQKVSEEERKSVMYTSGASGLDTNAAGSIQAQVIELVGGRNAVVGESNSKSGGSPINREQLYLFNPDVILFSPGSIYDTVAKDASWQQLNAIAQGSYYEIPGLPYNWMSNPPSINMLLGVWWLGNLLYPNIYDYDIQEIVLEFYQTFWQYQLTDEEVTQLLQKATSLAK